MKRFIASIMLLLSAIGFTQNANNPTAQDKIDIARKKAKKFLKKHGIPGMAISVSKKGELIWSEGFGYANINPKVSVKPDSTLFRIASISKSITAVLLGKLMDDKIIDLDQSIYNYVPDYPKKDYDFTIRQLSGHLAGIRHYKDEETVLNKKMTITEGLDLFKNDPLLFEPSTQFLYNSFGYVLLSEIIQKATKTDFNVVASNLLFKPLNLKNTMVDTSDADIPNRTNFYRKKNIISSPVANEYKVAGGGFLSTSEDITTFGYQLISPSIISKEALSQIITSQRIKSNNITGYGIGFSISKTKKETPKYFHTGGGVGASSILCIYPNEEIVITVLTNLSGVSMEDFGKELEAVFVD